MRTRPTILYFSPDGAAVPELVARWAESRAYAVRRFDSAAEVESIVLRGHPSVLVLNGDDPGGEGLELVRRLKRDAYTAIVPAAVLASRSDPESVQQWFVAGADEVLSTGLSEAEQRCRAWTYVRPGYIGAAAVCYLKERVTRPVRKPCCISGAVR